MIEPWMLVPVFALIGAFLYRWRGAGWKIALLRPFPQGLFALAYSAAVWADDGKYYAVLAVWLLTTAALTIGHGNFQDLGTAPRGPKERLEYPIWFLHGKIPEYWYDALGLVLTGLIVSIPTGVVLLNPLVGISGALEAPAYMLARKLGWNNAGGEWLTGAFLWGALAAGVLYA